jgi:hypothetical protein
VRLSENAGGLDRPRGTLFAEGVTSPRYSPHRVLDPRLSPGEVPGGAKDAGMTGVGNSGEMAVFRRDTEDKGER